MNTKVLGRIERITGIRSVSALRLNASYLNDIFAIELMDGSSVIAKMGGVAPNFEVEGFSLRYLANKGGGFPVPKVIYSDQNLLLMHRIPSDGKIDARTEIHAADLVAGLHNVSGLSFGFERNTQIGGLTQINSLSDKWVDFFRDHRLLKMGHCCVSSGRLPPETMNRLERVAGKLKEWLDGPTTPSLIHGDLWNGNVLCLDGRVTGFIDPAIYFADPEIELAFISLFNTFGKTFFARYDEHRPIRPGFFEIRCDIYNIYPILVHIRLFGGS